jgi:hypothetical protein
LFYKKYKKFYLNKFIPITEYEKENRQINKKISLIIECASIVVIPFVFRVLTKTFSIIKNKPQTVITKENFWSEYFNSSFNFLGLAFLGLFIGSNYGNIVIFSNTDYLRYRLFYEKSIGYVRKEGDFYDDYPFAHREKYLLNDFEVKRNNSYIKRGKPLKAEPVTQQISQDKIKIDNFQVNNSMFNTYRFENEKN